MGSANFGNFPAVGPTRIFDYGYSLGGQLDSNFVVCSVGTVPTEGVVTVIPFVNNYATTTDAITNELFALEHDDWLWKVMIVVGTDRNMFGVGFYPTAVLLTTDGNYLTGTSNAWFADTNPVTVALTSNNAFSVAGVTADEFIIGASGVLSKIT